MTTFSQLVDSTILYLHGFTVNQDQSTYLTQPASASDLTLSVASPNFVSRGIIEIGDELIMAESVDQVSSTVQVPPFGRGFRGTTPVAHGSGTRVIASPMFPRVVVQQALNEAIDAVFPTLYAVSSVNPTFVSGQTSYALPSVADAVLAVEWKNSTTRGEWIPVRRWRAERDSLSIYDAVPGGAELNIVYSHQPTRLTLSDDFSASGLASSAEDIIRLGASSRLVPFIDAAHLSGFSAEADFSANNRQVGTSAQTSRYLTQLYQVRLQEEANRLARVYPIRSHYTR